MEGLAHGCRASKLCLKLSRRVLRVPGLRLVFSSTYSLFFCQDAAKLMRKTVFGKLWAGVMTQNVQTGLKLWEGLANGCRAS